MDWEKTFFKQMAANSADAFRSALELKRVLTIGLIIKNVLYLFSFKILAKIHILFM